MEGAIRVTWGRPAFGHEKDALALFQDTMTYYGKKLADAKIFAFEPYLLTTGDESVETGFIIVKAPITEIFTILDEAYYKELNMRAFTILDHFRIDLLAAGEAVGEQMKLYESLIPSLRR